MVYLVRITVKVCIHKHSGVNVQHIYFESKDLWLGTGQGLCLSGGNTLGQSGSEHLYIIQFNIRVSSRFQ